MKRRDNHEWTIQRNRKQGTQDTRRRQTKQSYNKKQKDKHTTICVGHRYTQTNTNNVNKTWTLLQTTHDPKQTVVRFKCIAKEQKMNVRYYINLTVIILFKWYRFFLNKSIYNVAKLTRTEDLCFTQTTIQWYWIDLSCGIMSWNNVLI